MSAPFKRDVPVRISLFIFSALSLTLIVGLPMLAMLMFAIFPNFNELSFSAPFTKFPELVADKGLLEAIFNSLRLAIAVTLLSAIISVPLGYFRSQMSNRIGHIWDVLFLLPFLIPPYIGSLSWMQLLQRNGFLEQFFGFNLSSFLFSFIGLATVMALHLFPLIYFTVSKSFSVVGARYSEVAQLFGGNRLTVFFKIDLPMVLPALLGSSLLVFILTIEEFGTPEILGRRFGFEVMVTAIHDKFSNWPIDLSAAAVLSLILVLIAFAAYRLQLFFSSRYSTAVDNQKLILNAKQGPLVTQLLVNSLFLAVSFVAVLLPIFSILASSFMERISMGLVWSNIGTSNFRQLFSDESEGAIAIWTSLGLAGGAAIATAMIGLIVVFTIVRLRPRGSQFLDFLSILPNSIPGMAIAVGLILVWNLSIWPLTPYNTVWILLLAYLCLMLPYPIRMLTSALQQLPKSLDEAAYISGANEWRVIFKILTPLLLPISFAAGLIVFAISTRELVSSLMLAPPGVETVATFVFRQFDQGDINVGMAMSLLVILISGTIIAIGQRLQGRLQS